MFINILTIDNKYSIRNWENLPQSIQMQLSKKQKPLPEFFATFALLLHLFHFFFWKTWLEKFLKRPVTEHCSTVNKLKDPKQCWNLQISIFIKFPYESEESRVKKFAGNDKHSLRKRENLQQSIQMQLSYKKKLSLHFYSISEIYIKFSTFWK